MPLEVTPPPPLRIASQGPKTESDYSLPPPAIEELLRSPPPPEASVHPEAGFLLLAHRESLIPLERLARPQLSVAGLRLDKETFCSPATTWIVKLELISLRKVDTGGKPLTVFLTPPTQSGFLDPKLSPDGRWLAAVVVSESSSEVGVYSLKDQTWAFKGGPVQMGFGSACQWTQDSRLYCNYVPAAPRTPPEPTYAPSIQEHFGGPLRVTLRTRPLTGASDEAILDYYLAGEIREVDLAVPPEIKADKSKKSSEEEPEEQEHNPYEFSRPLGPVGVISAFSPSPDGEWLHVTTLKKPYSRITGFEYFPRAETIWHKGENKAVLALRLEKGSELTFLGPPLGRRQTAWHPHEPATLTWIDRSINKRIVRERWLAQAMPPQKGSLRTLKTAFQIADRGFTSLGTPWITASGPDFGPLQNGSPEVSHGYQASPGKRIFGDALRADCAGGLVLEHSGAIFVSAERADQGGGPTLSSVSPLTGESTLLWKSPPNQYEKVLCVLDQDTWITSRETAYTAPQYLVHKRGEIARPLTQAENPYPAMSTITRRLVRYIRDDGLQLNAELYLPPNYKEGHPVPTVVWIYPTEYTEAGYATHTALASAHRFPIIAGPSRLALALAGYAVLDNPSMPIVGENGQENDNYLNHLRMSAEAAVRFLVKERIATPGKIAVGGRSYGAFSAANLLAHTDLFATAIAISGAYNRTLTPFGFQNERRSLWKESELYARMSPFFSASEINEPLLLIHGQDDDNPGTPLMQSERMFHAVVGIGGRARLVVLPLEGHQMRGDRTVLHVASEMISWLDRHLRPEKKRLVVQVAPSAAVPSRN